MKEIIIEISEKGEVRIETRGFSGNSCISETQFLKDLLGKETACQLTPAYYQSNTTVIKKHLPLCG